MKQLSECTVLIVDDTKTNIDILVEALGGDYEIAVATSGKAALENIELELPDLILLDIMMPGMSGYEVCNILKADPKTAEIPVIFLTAVTDIESKNKGFEAGAVDYITKPFEITEIKARVHTHLSLRMARLELAKQNEILEEKVEERTREISLTQETTIELMAYLAEFRDPETGGHIKRTKKYVRILAETLSNKPEYRDILDSETIDDLYNSAPLHDIGKIGIRDEILLKPGKLTPEEYEEMKRHSLIGYEALAQAKEKLGENSFLKCAMELARSHHERWDGFGYPDGLSGKKIPLAGRIMAIADVYDALISRRPYKEPYSHERAVAIITDCRGTQFDPELVDVFLEVETLFNEIALEYAELVSEEKKEDQQMTMKF